MLRLRKKSNPVPSEAAEVSGGTPARSQIAEIMEKYRTSINGIRPGTAANDNAIPTAEPDNADQDIINRARLEIQKVNTVVDGIGNEVRRLEAYGKVLTMLRRSLNSEDRKYAYSVIKKYQRP